MALLNKFRRVSKRQPCPVCGKPDWYLISTDDTASPSRVICARVESPLRWGDAGWLHQLREDGGSGLRRFRRALKASSPGAGMVDVGILADRFTRALSAPLLGSLCSRLGLNPEGLAQLGLGWASAIVLSEAGTRCQSEGVRSFPMRNAAGRVVGIRLRTRVGFKYSITGSKQGLFIPNGLKCDRLLLVTEGPTDAAALLDMGFNAIGRPSCNVGRSLVRAVVQARQPSEVVVVADNDVPGQRGADQLAKAVLPYCRTVRVITPPSGLNDVREWKKAGATAKDVMAAIAASKPYALQVRTRFGGRQTTHA